MYAFDQLIDFTRTSSGTFIGSNGLIQTTPASRNLLTWTQQFDNAAWVKSNITTTADATTAPDGTMTADRLEVSSAAGSQTYQALTTVGAGFYVYSIYAKQGSGATDSNSFGLRNNTTSVNLALLSINYTTGVITQTVGSGATATDVGNGWWRIAMPVALGATVGDAIRFYAGTNGAVETIGEFCFVWGAQFEVIPDASLTLGSELISSGAIGLVGAATAATYNTGTGAGSVTRVDLANQSFVQWSGLSGNYRTNITANTGVAVSARSGGSSGTPYTTSAVVSTVTGYVPSSGGQITITSGGGTTTFTVNSFRQITGTVGMPTAYTRNVGGLFPARFEYDPITLAPRGILIEEQRTNLFLRSAEFDNGSWTKSGGSTVPVTTNVAPDGTASADTIQALTTSSFVSQNVVFTGSGNKSFSVFLKAGTATVTRLVLRDTTVSTNRGGVNITWTAGVPSAAVTEGTLGGIDAYPNGWYRIRMIATGVVDTPNINQFRFSPDTSVGTGTTIFWGAQTENEELATSYIPTVASQVTRTADQVSIIAPMFAPWYNQTEGTFTAEFAYSSGTSADSPNTRALISANDGTNSNRVSIYNRSGVAQSGLVTVAGATVASPGTGTSIGTNVVAKAAFAYKANDFNFALNGALGNIDTSGALPVVSRLTIGAQASGSVINGYVRNISYYPVRLSDTQLQALTA